MAPPKDPPSRSTVFANSDPFHPSDDQDAKDHNEGEELPRLTGVRSNNPFASTSTGQNESGSADASNGGARPRTPESDEYIDPGMRTADQRPEDIPASAGLRSHEKAEASPQRADGNVDQERGDRPTIAFAEPSEVYAGDGTESPGRRNSNSDSSSKLDPSHVSSSQGDEIGRAPAKQGSSDSLGNNFVEKFKDLGHEAKEKLHLQDLKVAGPLKGFNPTTARMRLTVKGADDGREVGIIWRSRDNRKGRNSVVVPRASMAYPNVPPQKRPVYSSSFKGVGRNLYRMAFTFPYWDMAFWSGWSYTWGSVLFVIDGVWAWGPVGWDVEWTGLTDYGVGIVFFIGALLYQIGAVIAYLEAVNDGSFHGSAMRRFLEGNQDETKNMLDEKVSNFLGHLNPLHERKRHAEEEAEEERMRGIDPEAGWKTIERRERPGSIYPTGKAPAPRRGGVDHGPTEEGESHEYMTWRWWPTWEALKNHHVYEIGYIACSIQLFGVTLYGLCGVLSIPHVTSTWSNADFYGAYYLPDILGSCCFLTASILFLVETQEKWWKPQFNVMGWWIGFWAKIGSWGFLLNGIFGVSALALPDKPWVEYAADCCTTWGSFAYLLSSVCQWYEAVNKHPVEELFDEPGEMKSWQVHPI